MYVADKELISWQLIAWAAPLKANGPLLRYNEN